jgi:hypothetical protein
MALSGRCDNASLVPKEGGKPKFKLARYCNSAVASKSRRCSAAA